MSVSMRNDGFDEDGNRCGDGQSPQPRFENSDGFVSKRCTSVSLRRRLDVYVNPLVTVKDAATENKQRG